MTKGETPFYVDKKDADGKDKEDDAYKAEVDKAI